MTIELTIKQIRRDGGTQPRAGLNEDKVQEYVEAKQDGAQFPPATVFYDGENYWLSDGFHRTEADLRLGRETIMVDLVRGTQRDAILHSVGANATHGLPRSREDKRRAVLTLLEDEEWGSWSDREIARRCNVSNRFVGMVREESTVNIHSVRKTADGRTMDVSNIGKLGDTPKHWGNGYDFWQEVDRLGLNKETILEEMQPGATKVTDLEMEKGIAWARLLLIATRKAMEVFPHNSYVYHPSSGRVAKIWAYSRSPMGMVLDVYDAKDSARDTWLMDGLEPATQEQLDAYVNPQSKPEPPLHEGDPVITRTGHLGFVMHINAAFHHVETINGIKPHYREQLVLVDTSNGSFLSHLTPEQVNDFRILTARELEKWNEQGGAVAEPEAEATENPFKVGDRVQWKDGRGNGTIRYIKGQKCGVYLDASHTTHYYEWTELVPEDEFEYKVGDRVFIQGNRTSMNFKNDHVGVIRELLQNSAVVWTAADDGRWENVNVSFRWMRAARESELTLEMPEPEDIPVEFETPETFDASEQFSTYDNAATNEQEPVDSWVSVESVDPDEQLRKAIDALNLVVEYERGNLGQGQLVTEDYDIAIEWLQARRAAFDAESTSDEINMKNEVETW